MTEDEFVWLRYPETGGTQRFAIGAVGAWTARGWKPCDPPAEVDPTRAHAVEAAPPEAADAASTDSAPEPAADPKTTRERRATVAGSAQGG